MMQNLQRESMMAEIVIDCGDFGVVQVAEPIDGFALLKQLPNKPKNAIALEIDGVLRDLSTTIDKGCHVLFMTSDDPRSYEILRHDAAHIMAEAVKELYPDTQVTIGPAIENGFYYDFAREKSFTPEDLEKIEQRMAAIVDRNEKIVREEWDRGDAIAFFKKQGEHFKAEIIADIPGNEPITLYRQGEFIDLCRGPHLPSTGKLGKAFKLMKLAGAYWRGDSSKPMLQRIYGTAWWKKEDLENYLKQLEEAEKRDHRRLGREMHLFHLQEEAPGAIFWHPQGWTLYRLVEDYMRRRLEAENYCEVRTPQLLDRHFWEKSGHWDKFGDNMFVLETEGKTFSLKPMSCPCHVQIFRQGIKSYKDLPIRMAEFGCCHRFEPSGALHGIMRLRAFVQDDAHIFCTEDQINEESQRFCTLLQQVYRDFGFDSILIKFSDRPEKRAGSDEIWDKAEGALRNAAQASGLEVVENPGEGAFYGPKLEFVLRDAIGREWQCGTLQVDFVLPERLDASYVGADGQKHRPVMLHRAILGSLERFIGVLIEHTAGHLPLWLSPTQVVVATITDDAVDYARQIGRKLKEYNIRYEFDLRNEKISYKIREHSLAKVPLILVVGKREAEQNQVAIRRLGSQDQQVLGLEETLSQVQQWTKAPV